jgi:hypothetical protein
MITWPTVVIMVLLAISLSLLVVGLTLEIKSNIGAGAVGLLVCCVIVISFQTGANWQRVDTLSKYKLTPLNQPAP